MGHAGAWRALEEGGFRPCGLLGTSIGALVAAALAGGLGWLDLAPRVFSLRKEDLVRVNRRVIWVNGLRAVSVFQAEPLRAYIEALLPIRRWEELRHPLQINAVDLASGETHWFGTGARTDVPLVDAVYASCALPVLYPPAFLGGGWFVDGGAVDALPLHRAAELGATGMVALDAGSGGGVDASLTVSSGLVAIHSRIFSMASERRRRDTIREWRGIPLRLVRPHLDGYGSFDFEHAGYFLEEGYRATRAALSRWGTPVRARPVLDPLPVLPPPPGAPPVRPPAAGSPQPRSPAAGLSQPGSPAAGLSQPGSPAPGGLRDQAVERLRHDLPGEPGPVGEDTEDHGPPPVGHEVP